MTTRTPKRRAVYLGHCQICGNPWTMARGVMVEHGAVSPGLDRDKPCPGSRHLPVERDRLAARSRAKALHALAAERLTLASKIEAGEAPAPFYRLVKGNQVPVDGAELDRATRERQRAAAVADTRLSAVMAEKEAQRITLLASERWNGAFLRERLPRPGDMVQSLGIIAGPPIVPPGTFGVVHRMQNGAEPGFFAVGIHWSTGSSCTIQFPAQRVSIIPVQQ